MLSPVVAIPYSPQFYNFLGTDQSSSRPKWNNLLFEHQNITENYIALTSINKELEIDNEIRKDHNAKLEAEIKLLNRTLLEFASRELATIEGREKLMEEIDNLTKTNAQLAEEYGKVVQRSAEQEETLANVSRALADLSTFSSELQVEKQKVEETNKLLQDDNNKCQERSMKETEKLQNLVKETKEKNENSSFLLDKGNTELEQYKERQKKLEAELQSVEEAYHSLDLYCPVANQNTQGMAFKVDKVK